jgi:hypothetical protein
MNQESMDRWWVQILQGQQWYGVDNLAETIEDSVISSRDSLTYSYFQPRKNHNCNVQILTPTTPSV